MYIILLCFLIKLYAVFVTFLKRNRSLQEHVTWEILCRAPLTVYVVCA